MRPFSMRPLTPRGKDRSTNSDTNSGEGSALGSFTCRILFAWLCDDLGPPSSASRSSRVAFSSLPVSPQLRWLPKFHAPPNGEGGP